MEEIAVSWGEIEALVEVALAENDYASYRQKDVPSAAEAVVTALEGAGFAVYSSGRRVG